MDLRIGSSSREVDDFFDALAVGDFFALCPPPEERARQHGLPHVDVPRRHQVVQHRGIGVERDILESAGDAQRRAFVGRHARDVDAFKADAAGLRRIKAVDAVDEAGFSRAVGSDDGEDLASLDLEVDALQRLDAAKTQRDVIDMQLDRHAAPFDNLWYLFYCESLANEKSASALALSPS